MLKIGEFSALSVISVSMLRHYDKLGLLVPAYIDQTSGYRYYDKAQLVRANQIAAMKAMGFGLEEIKKAMQINDEEKQVLLEKKLAEKKAEFLTLQKQIRKLEETINLGREEESYALSIVKKQMPKMNVVSYKNKISDFNKEGILWAELMKKYEMYKIDVSEEALAIAVQHDVKEDEKEIEVMLSTSKKYKSVGNLVCYEVPAREVASIIFKGSYEQIGKINTFVAKWLEANQYEICDKAFSIYHNSPRESREEATFVTEICFPICKK